ncbi:MAG: class I SAM-dependent methyltransferase [Puia sp.]
MFRKIIASQFKRPSGLFGIFSSNIMIKGNKNKYIKLIEDLDLRPLDSILEIGYGPGIGIHMITEKCNTCTIRGIDFSNLMYKKATQLNRRFINGGNVQLQKGDFLKMPSTGKMYNKIFCLNVVYFWNELKSPFEKIYLMLKPVSAFHIYMASSDMLRKMKAPEDIFNKYSIEQVIDTLKLAGFTDVIYSFDKGFYIKALKGEE